MVEILLSMIRPFIIAITGLLFISVKIVTPSDISNSYQIKRHTEDTLALKELGHLLFFDKNLSYGRDISCASCHDPHLAFTDGYVVSVNSKAEKLLRNSPSLLNLQHRHSFNWANSKITTLEDQMNRPLFGSHPVELGLKDHEEEIFRRFGQSKHYKKIIDQCCTICNGQLNIEIVKKAIAKYINGLDSRKSDFDKFKLSGDSSTMSPLAREGFNLFHSDSIDCAACHGGNDFFEPERGGEFANIGLYNCNGEYPARDPGLQSEDGDKDYNGVFRIPTLRNVAITAPYYHDGSESSLDQILRNYERQGRMVNYGDCRGDGSQHPMTDGRMQKFSLNDHERQAIIAFLETLTDTSYLTDSYFSNPFE